MMSDTPISLVQVCRERLKNRPAWLTIKQISAETGLPVAWISTLGRKKFKNPHVSRIEQLIAYLGTINQR